MWLLWMWAGLSCFLSSGDGYVGELLELQQGCDGTLWKYQMLDVISLKTPQRKWALSRLEGRTSWIFSRCGRCSRLTTGTSGTRSGGLREGQSPCELLGGLSGFLSRRSRGLRHCVESVPEPEDSSPVMTWILGYFWSFPRRVSPRLEGGCTCAFLPISSSSVALPFAWIKGSVPFPRGFPKGLSHVPPWCVSMSILGLKVKAVQGEQVSLEWAETSGGLWEWWHDPEVPLAFPVESASS